MPNHVANVIKMQGIKNLPLFSTKEGILYFDFNKLIPMPKSLNMESNSVEDLAIEAVMRKLSKSRFFGKNYKQISDEDWEKRVIIPGKNVEELQKAGLQYISNQVLYDVTTWYDWCYNNWGTKWNSYEFEFEDNNTIRFQTAWNCPEPVIQKLAQVYLDIRIEHWWADEDCGSNSGYRVYENGKVYGDYDEQCSSDAYEHYEFCWGGSNCIYQDENGNYCRHNCETCNGCDG